MNPTLVPIHPRRIIILALISVLLTVLVSFIGFDNDYCVHYHAAALFLSGQPPYDAAANSFLAQTCLSVRDGAGSAYPLPFLLIIAPLTWLPFQYAAIIWNLIGTFLVLLAWLLVDESPKMLALAILFLPSYIVIALGQSTMIWFGLSVLLIMGIQRRWWLMVGCCIALLPWKPQAGLIFALAGCWWAWRNERRALLVAALGTLLLISGALLARPHWVYEWLAEVRIYASIIKQDYYGIFAPLLVLACWKMPWWAKIAALQALLFPVSNPYMVVQFLLIWLPIGGWSSLVLASLSYLWLHLPDDIRWFAIILPITAAAFYHVWVAPVLQARRLSTLADPAE
jgi:hypothetical protein